MDPAAMNNNVQKWDMQLMAVNPWYAKRTLVEKWIAHQETVTANGFDEETITIANRGHLPVWPLFIYTGPGTAWVQDGMTTKMIQLPKLSAADKYGLVDTDPSHRTLTGATDPVDNIFYQIIRQSKILDFFLHDVEAQGSAVVAAGERDPVHLPDSAEDGGEHQGPSRHCRRIGDSDAAATFH
jgi:hypothetical protein